MLQRIIDFLEKFDKSFFPKYLYDGQSIEDSYNAHKLYYMLWFLIVLSIALGIVNVAMASFFRALNHVILIVFYALGLLLSRHHTVRKIYIWFMTIALIVIETYVVFTTMYPYILFVMLVIPSAVFVVGKKFFSVFVLAYHAFLYYHAMNHFELFIDMTGKNKIEWLYSWISIMLITYFFLISFDLAAFYAFKLFHEEVRRRDELSDHLMTHNRIKDQIFSIIGHDLKNPLSQVKTYVELGKYHGICDDETTMNTLMKNTDNAIDLLHNLIDWARRRWEDIKPKMITFSLLEMVNSLLKYFQTNFEQKNVLFENKFTHETLIVSDPEMVTTVLRNLIQNALKFTHSQGKVSLSYEVTKQHHIIHIEDTGVGMNQEQIKSIMHSRKIQSSRGTQKEPGSGLGLVICKDFLERLGGFLTITSTENKGSVFSIHLPILEF